MIGRIVHNYRIEELIGEGGMGTVYRAVDTMLGRDVALKMLHPNLINQSTFFDRFKNEAQILARLNHPNIATLHNFIQDEGDYFMVMEYIEGADLEKLLKTNGKFSVEATLQIMQRTLNGLMHAHARGISHRDLKPANLILTPEKEVKVMDFGIAKAVGGEKLTQVNRLIGTLEYIAPELLKGGEPSAQSDLYAIGVVMYEMLSGKMPFTATTDFDLMQQIIHQKPMAISAPDVELPKSLVTIINRLLDKNPDRRFPDAASVKQALSNVSLDIPKVTNNPLASISMPSVTIPKVTIPKLTLPKFAFPKLGDVSKVWWILGVSVMVAIAIISLSPEKPAVSTNSTKIIPERDDSGISGDEKLVENANSPSSKEKFPTSNPVNTEEKKPVEDSKNTAEKAKKTEQEQRKSERENDGKTTKDKKRDESKTYPPEQKKETPPEQKIPEKPADVISEKKPIEQPVERPKTPVGEATKITISNQRVIVSLRENVSSDVVQEGKSLNFEVARPVVVQGKTIFEAGASVRGYVSDVRRSTAFRKETLEIRVKEIRAANGEWVDVKAAVFRQVAKSSNEKVTFTAGQQFVAETTYKILKFN